MISGGVKKENEKRGRDREVGHYPFSIGGGGEGDKAHEIIRIGGGITV